MDDFSLISTSPIFKQFITVEKEDMMPRGAPVVSGKAQDAAIQQKIDELDRARKRLSQLHAHDPLVLLKKSGNAEAALLLVIVFAYLIFMPCGFVLVGQN